MNWHHWLGLPHRIGADPRTDGAACCLVMAHILLADAGLTPPPLQPMVDAAVVGDWARLMNDYNQATVSIGAPERLSMTLLTTRNGIGLATVVEDGMLLVPHHKHGVIAFPADVLRGRDWRKLR
jgi:hypothetical protein